MKLSTEVKTHKLIFKDREKESLSLTEYQAQRIKEKWRLKENPIEIGDYAFSYMDIKEIKKIEHKESAPSYRSQSDTEYHEQWLEWFMSEFEHWKTYNELEERYFNKDNPHRSFQYKILKKYPNSTLQDQNLALMEFCKFNKQSIKPAFMQS